MKEKNKTTYIILALLAIVLIVYFLYKRKGSKEEASGQPGQGYTGGNAGNSGGNTGGSQQDEPEKPAPGIEPPVPSPEKVFSDVPISGGGNMDMAPAPSVNMERFAGKQNYIKPIR